MTVGENIRRIRQERNLTQRQLGEMVGASEAYIRAYESGRNNMVGISFGTLSLMQSWLDRYEKYVEEVEKWNEIKDVKKRGEALLKAEADFNLWMDIYPESELWQERLKIQKAHDEVMDKIGLNPYDGNNIL